jgi:hypothetical protein
MTFESTPPPSMGLGRSVLVLPFRVAQGLWSLAGRQLSRLTDRRAAPVVDWTTEAGTTGPGLTEPIMPSELPIPSYDELAAADAARAIRELSDPDDVALMLAYEKANAKRVTVIRAAMSASNLT